jgi:phosphatidylinositol-4,5-bisphosphate 3-kinase
MDSKKVPLWLVFENADPSGDPIFVIFKSGDDLRQDLLTLQLLKIMENLWTDEGIEPRMNVYGCVATGDMEGMIEIVLNSDTSANITRTIAGGAKGAFRKDTFETWLKRENATADLYSGAVENFSLSCASYCVGTYVLGIGDRHNDNIMVTRSGQLFHIDFGHFLGNIKRKFGVKRERAPFVFTPDFAYVMGGEGAAKYKEFEEQCVREYQVLRRNTGMLITLFVLMLSTGIPELQSKSAIEYLRNALQVDASVAEASKYFKGLIKESLNSKATQWNNYVHIMAH